MQVVVEHTDRGLTVAIPDALVQETMIGPDTMVDLTVRNGRIIVSPLAEPEETLEEMLTRITPENIHPEIDFGPPVGRELL